MKETATEWIINAMNYLIYILIFYRAIGSQCFNTLDLTASLIGISASTLFLLYKVLNKNEEEI